MLESEISLEDRSRAEKVKASLTVEVDGKLSCCATNEILRLVSMEEGSMVCPSNLISLSTLIFLPEEMSFPANTFKRDVLPLQLKKGKKKVRTQEVKNITENTLQH